MCRYYGIIYNFVCLTDNIPVETEQPDSFDEFSYSITPDEASDDPRNNPAILLKLLYTCSSI